MTAPERNPDLDPVDCDDPRDLEDALIDIRGVAEVLQQLGTNDRAAGYLGDRLKEHYDTALDAFRRACKLDQYRTEGETRAAEAMAAPPPDAGTAAGAPQAGGQVGCRGRRHNDGGGGAAMSAAELFRNWLGLREAEYRRGQDDDEVERLNDEMIAIERAILAADPATAEDEQAQVAMLAYYAVHEAPYANYEVLDRCYRRWSSTGCPIRPPESTSGKGAANGCDGEGEAFRNRLVGFGQGSPAGDGGASLWNLPCAQPFRERVTGPKHHRAGASRGHAKPAPAGNLPNSAASLGDGGAFLLG